MYILYKNIDIFQNEIKYILYKCDEGGGAGKKHPSTQTQKFPKEEKRKSFLVSFLYFLIRKLFLEV